MIAPREASVNWARTALLDRIPKMPGAAAFARELVEIAEVWSVPVEELIEWIHREKLCDLTVRRFRNWAMARAILARRRDGA